MERHKCKLCSRTFANGRALGGHMKAHLATLPLPSSKPQLLPHPPNNVTEFASLSYSETESDTEEEEQRRETEEEKSLAYYVLRENPKKSFRLADPEFSGSVVVQDRESETESKNHPTRQQRSKRTRTRNRNFSLGQSHQNHQKKPKSLSCFIESHEQPLSSSVSDTSPEEDVAMCLMMLSRDKWRNKNVVEEHQHQHQQQDQPQQEQEQEEEFRTEKGIKLKKVVRGKHQCENCGKTFRSSRALGSHTSICCRDGAAGGEGNDKIFECPFCFKVFGSGQALGGHKRSHLMASSSSTTTNNVVKSFIDLNLPAAEEDEFSVVSDVSDV